MCREREWIFKRRAGKQTLFEYVCDAVEEKYKAILRGYKFNKTTAHKIGLFYYFFLKAWDLLFLIVIWQGVAILKKDKARKEKEKKGL